MLRKDGKRKRKKEGDGNGRESWKKARRQNER